MKEKLFTVRNKAGIHCRPSSVILNTIHQEFPLHTFVIRTAAGEETELNSILNLISLGLSCGDRGTLCVDGPEADKALDRIGDLLEFEFDFPPHA